MTIPAFVSQVRTAALHQSERFKFFTLHFSQDKFAKNWELIQSPASHRTSLLLFNEDTNSFLLSRKFRPALLVRVPGGLPSEAGTPEGLTCSTKACITTEMITCRSNTPHDTAPLLARARKDLGYNIPGPMRHMTGFRTWGERNLLYIATVGDADRVEDVPIFSLPVGGIEGFIIGTEHIKAVDICIALEWWKRYGQDTT